MSRVPQNEKILALFVYKDFCTASIPQIGGLSNCFPKSLTTYTTKIWGMGTFPPTPFHHFEKIVKIRTTPKNLKYKPVSWCRPTPYYRSIKYKSIMYLKVGHISYIFTMADKNEVLAIFLHSCAIHSDRTNFVKNRGPTATHLPRSQEFKKIRIKLQIQPKRECVGAEVFLEKFQMKTYPGHMNNNKL